MNLKDLRNDLGLTQTQIAKTLKCSQKKISSIEKQRTKLQIDDLAKLIKAYNLTTDIIKDLILDQTNEKEAE